MSRTLGHWARFTQTSPNPQKKEFQRYDCSFDNPWMGIPSLLAHSPMLSETRADAVVYWAPAKVNLYLEVLAKRADGYHDIESLMVAVSLYDQLTFKKEPGGRFCLRCNHAALSTGADNLICKAAELLRQHTGCKQGANVRLKKRIPMAAGLAGGSSDAAATLAGLNDLWQLGLSRAELVELAAKLGSDVAFFFATPAAWCTGRGEQVKPVTLGKELHLVLVCPPEGLSTADVYRGVAVPAKPASGDGIRAAVAAGDIDAVGRHLHNRLQPVAEHLCPAVADYRQRLESVAPVGQLMSGSGTSLYGVARNRHDALRIARLLRLGMEQEAGPLVCPIHSCL